MIYVMSDIHGDFQSFYKMLVKINFSSYDELFILGDIVDKGKENLCLLDFIWKNENIYLIKGNHEYLFERYLQGIVTAEIWDACGGTATRREVDRLSVDKKADILMFLKGLPIYRNITIKDKSYFLTHSGYHADFESIDPKTGLVDIQKSVDGAVAWDQEQYLFSNDIHYIPQKIKFDKRIIVGHYATLFLTEYRQANIYYGERYIDIDTGNERRNKGERLACLRLNDGKEYYV